MFNPQSSSFVVDKLLFPVGKKTNCRPPPPIVPPNGCIDKAKIRKYPCGFPGCQWVFTRTNHVVRHHERVHPGFRPNNNDSRSSNSNNLTVKQNLKNEGDKGSPVASNAVTSPATSTTTPVSGHGFKLREALTGFHLCYVTGCKQRFNTKNELNIHLFHVHSVVEPEVCIKVEGQEWNDEENTTLLTNKLSSSLDRRYICDAIGCGKAYTKNSHLIRHKEDSHNVLRPPHPLKFVRSPRPYACTLPGCDKTYTKNSHLIRHLVETHKMAKPPPKVNRRLTPNFGPPLTNGSLQLSSSTSSSSSSLSSSPSSAITPTPASSSSTTTTTITTPSSISTTTNRSADSPMIYNDRPYACTFPGCGWSFKRQYHLNRHIITHRINNNRKDGNNNNNNNNNNNSSSRSHNNNGNNNSTNNLNNFRNTNNNNNNNFNNSSNISSNNLSNGLNSAADLSALINLARNLAAARAKSESISWIVLEDGDDDDDQESSDEQLKDLPTRRHISIEEDSFCCDFPGCNKVFLTSRDLMEHYLGHSGPSSGLLLGSHLINSAHSNLSDMLEEPPLECVLEEFGDEDADNGDEDQDDEGDEDDADEHNLGHNASIKISESREYTKYTATDSD